MSDIPSPGSFEGPNNPPTDNNSVKPQQEGITVQPFYDAGLRLDHSIDKEIPYKRIVDPKVAEEIANVEKDQGRDAALQFEEAKRMEHETGLTEDERYNQELINIFATAFPDVFETVIDENTGEKWFRGGIPQRFSKNFLNDLDNFRNQRFNSLSAGKIVLFGKLNGLESKENGLNLVERRFNMTDGDLYFTKRGVTKDIPHSNEYVTYTSLNRLSEDYLNVLTERLGFYNAYIELAKSEIPKFTPVSPEDIRRTAFNKKYFYKGG